MRVRRLLATAVAALLVLPASAPAHTAGPDADTALDARRLVADRTGAQLAVTGPDGWERQGPVNRPSSLIRDALIAREGLPAARAARAFVAERWDEPGLLPTGGTSDSEEVSGPEEWEPEPGTVVYTTGVGDLTGDGAGDLLLALETIGRDDDDLVTVRVDLEARRGRNGSLLWRAEDIGNDAFAWPAGDLTGNGATDMLSLVYERTSFEDSSGCDDGGCHFLLEGHYERALRLRDGRSGRVVWEDVGPAWERLEETWDDEGYDLDYELQGVLLPSLADDYDGDGGLDLAETMIESFTLQARVEHTDVGPVWVDEVRAWQRATTRDAVRSGSTGRATPFAESVDAPEIGLLMTAGDLTGDGVVDLARERFEMADVDTHCLGAVVVGVCAEPAEYTTSIDAVEAASLTTLWTTEFDGDGYLWPLEADATGDGRDDLAVTVAGAAGTSQVLLGGAGGDERWQRAVDHVFDVPVAIGDVTGRDAADLVSVSFRTTSGPPLPVVAGSEPAVVLTRLHGGTGAELFDSRWVPPEDADAISMWAGIAGDLTGDGVRDLLAGYAAYAYDESDSLQFLSSVEVLESGRDGTVGLEAVDEPRRLLIPVLDLDGDGLADVYDVQLAEDSIAAGVTALRAPGWELEELWHAHRDFWWELPWPVGDLDGTPGADLAEMRLVQRGPLVGYRLAVLDGLTLEEWWSVQG